MKRKRFIKLVMACGIQRNGAEFLARQIDTEKSYENLYKKYAPYLKIRAAFTTLWKQAAKVVESVKSSFMKFSYQLQDTAAAINSAKNRRTADNEDD
jgi:hypothetical protein